jgi:hypothetical protein
VFESEFREPLIEIFGNSILKLMELKEGEFKLNIDEESPNVEYNNSPENKLMTPLSIFSMKQNMESGGVIDKSPLSN